MLVVRIKVENNEYTNFVRPRQHVMVYVIPIGIMMTVNCPGK